MLTCLLKLLIFFLVALLAGWCLVRWAAVMMGWLVSDLCRGTLLSGDHILSLQPLIPLLTGYQLLIWPGTCRAPHVMWRVKRSLAPHHLLSSPLQVTTTLPGMWSHLAILSAQNHAYHNTSYLGPQSEHINRGVEKNWNGKNCYQREFNWEYKCE